MTKYDQAIGHILATLKENLPSELSYHSYEHTLHVLSLAEEIGKHENVSGEEFELLKVAAAFHDCGYLDGLHEHEINGCKKVDALLPTFGFSREECSKINGMIMATRLPQSPKNHLEEIICDADLGYIGGNSYFEIVEGLRAEIIATSHPITQKEWLDMQISFLNAQSFFTTYANQTFDSKKREVLEILKRQRKAEP